MALDGGVVGENEYDFERARFVLQVSEQGPLVDGRYESVDLLACTYYAGDVRALLNAVMTALHTGEGEDLPPQIAQLPLAQLVSDLEAELERKQPDSAPVAQGLPQVLADDLEPKAVDEPKDKPALQIPVAQSPVRRPEGLHAVNWADLFSRPRRDVRWLCEPILEAGRLVSLYSPAKAGKSLLMLEVAVALAAGRPVLGNPARPPMQVLYVDKENGEDDILERLKDMGCGPADLVNLHYLSFPQMPMLDSPQGGQVLLEMAREYGADLIVLDTLSRFFQGEENSNDTFRAVYNHSLMPLKREGITVLRLDHTGKDEDAGQRGGSAKNDDVDAVWQLKKIKDNRLRLTRTHSRTNHGADEVELLREAKPLRHTVVQSVVEDSTDDDQPKVEVTVEEWVEHLDALGVPQEARRDRAQQALNTAGQRISKTKATEVVAARKKRPTVGTTDLPACPDPRDPGGQGSRAGAAPDLPASPLPGVPVGQGSGSVTPEAAPVPDTLPSWLNELYDLLDGD